MIKVISHITLHCKAYSLCTELCGIMKTIYIIDTKIILVRCR